jgi:hypothetical protein
MTNGGEGQDNATVLLSVTEAASRLGLHPAALRSRIRRGNVAVKRGNSGGLLVEVPARTSWLLFSMMR